MSTPSPRRAIDVCHAFMDPLWTHGFLHRWAMHQGYWEHFGTHLARSLGVAHAEYEGWRQKGNEAFAGWLGAQLASPLTIHEHVAAMRSRGIEGAWMAGTPDPVEDTTLNERVAELQSQADGWLAGGAGIDLATANNTGYLDRAIGDWGLRFVLLEPFRSGVPISDPAWAPVLAWCAAADIPLWIHTGQHWAKDLPHDIEHPRHLDVLARTYPSLRVIAGHTGWPWMDELVALVWKHDNLWLDLSAHRPRGFPKPGSGFEPLLNRARPLAEKVLFGSAAFVLGAEPDELRDEVAALPLPPEVIERWLYTNAAEHFSDVLGRSGTPGSSA